MSREIKEEMVMPKANMIGTSLHYKSQESDLQGPRGHLIEWGTGLQRRRSEHILGGTLGYISQGDNDIPNVIIFLSYLCLARGKEKDMQGCNNQ